MFSDTLNELKIEESKDAHKLFEKMPVNKLLTDCGHNDRELSKDNLSCDDSQCLGDENDTDVVSENKKIRGLVNMGYGIDGSKVNSSANGIEEVSDCVMVLDDDCKETEPRVSGMDGDVRCDAAELEVSEMDVGDVVINSSKEDGEDGDFSNLLGNGKEHDGEQEENKDFGVCDSVQPGYPSETVLKCDFNREQEKSDSLFPTFGLNGLGDNGGICEPELETLGQILQWLLPNPNMMMTNSSGTPTDSCGEFEIKMSGLNGNSLIMDLEAAKMDEVSLGHLKFELWKWPKRKKIDGTKCKLKYGKWDFDIWKWPKKKKKRFVIDRGGYAARDFVEKKMADGKLCIIFKEAFAPYVADDDSSVAKAQQVVVVGGGYNGGICRDLWHFEGQEDEYKSCKVAAYTYVHSSDKSSNCDDEWYMHEEGSGKGLIGEEEMNINEKHKEELNKVTTSTVYMVSEIRNSPLVLRTTDICKLEMIRLGVRIKKKLV
ncbi:hypothetical protein Tco_0804114 [Tanacetum coccineum]|uniref:Uncharacterized protein n=1 Tax=Tanacetum coccineum TaxID=301880 RepID=A0ABQ5A695_9ASTR